MMRINLFKLEYVSAPLKLLITGQNRARCFFYVYKVYSFSMFIVMSDF